MERLQGSLSVLGWNDSRGVIPSQDRRTPGESFHPRTEGLHWSHSVLGYKVTPYTEHKVTPHAKQKVTRHIQNEVTLPIFNTM